MGVNTVSADVYVTRQQPLQQAGATINVHPMQMTGGDPATTPRYLIQTMEAGRKVEVAPPHAAAPQSSLFAFQQATARQMAMSDLTKQPPQSGARAAANYIISSQPTTYQAPIQQTLGATTYAVVRPVDQQPQPLPQQQQQDLHAPVWFQQLQVQALQPSDQLAPAMQQLQLQDQSLKPQPVVAATTTAATAGAGASTAQFITQAIVQDPHAAAGRYVPQTLYAVPQAGIVGANPMTTVQFQQRLQNPNQPRPNAIAAQQYPSGIIMPDPAATGAVGPAEQYTWSQVGPQQQQQMTQQQIVHDVMLQQTMPASYRPISRQQPQQPQQRAHITVQQQHQGPRFAAQATTVAETYVPHAPLQQMQQTQQQQADVSYSQYKQQQQKRQEQQQQTTILIHHHPSGVGAAAGTATGISGSMTGGPNVLQVRNHIRTQSTEPVPMQHLQQGKVMYSTGNGVVVGETDVEYVPSLFTGDGKRRGLSNEVAGAGATVNIADKFSFIDGTGGVSPLNLNNTAKVGFAAVVEPSAVDVKAEYVIYDQEGGSSVGGRRRQPRPSRSGMRRATSYNEIHEYRRPTSKFAQGSSDLMGVYDDNGKTSRIPLATWKPQSRHHHHHHHHHLYRATTTKSSNGNDQDLHYVTLTTQERYRRHRSLSSTPQVGDISGTASTSSSSVEFEPYTERDWQQFKLRDRHMRLPAGLGPNEDEEWRRKQQDNDESVKLHKYHEHKVKKYIKTPDDGLSSPESQPAVVEEEVHRHHHHRHRCHHHRNGGRHHHHHRRSREEHSVENRDGEYENEVYYRKEEFTDYDGADGELEPEEQEEEEVVEEEVEIDNSGGEGHGRGGRGADGKSSQYRYRCCVHRVRSRSRSKTRIEQDEDHRVVEKDGSTTSTSKHVVIAEDEEPGSTKRSSRSRSRTRTTTGPGAGKRCNVCFGEKADKGKKNTDTPALKETSGSVLSITIEDDQVIKSSLSPSLNGASEEEEVEEEVEEERVEESVSGRMATKSSRSMSRRTSVHSGKKSAGLKLDEKKKGKERESVVSLSSSGELEDGDEKEGGADDEGHEGETSVISVNISFK
ncbi:hypothetical protein HK102_007466 [Quaeritorhiza haematococci]|nr:hypothetical protein HK102_007466 [Quaeritorhiza haematococci]